MSTINPGRFETGSPKIFLFRIVPLDNLSRFQQTHDETPSKVYPGDVLCLSNVNDCERGRECTETGK